MNTKLPIPPKGFCGFKLFLCALIFLFLGAGQTVFAQYATGGSGLYRNNIYWFVQVNEGAKLSSGINRGYNLTIGNSKFITDKCTMNNFCSGAFFYVFRSDDWSENSLSFHRKKINH